MTSYIPGKKSWSDFIGVMFLLSAAGLLQYVWPFSEHQVIKG